MTRVYKKKRFHRCKPRRFKGFNFLFVVVDRLNWNTSLFQPDGRPGKNRKACLTRGLNMHVDFIVKMNK